MLNSYTICFLMTHKLFLTIISTSNFEVLQAHLFLGKVVENSFQYYLQMLQINWVSIFMTQQKIYFPGPERMTLISS